MTTNLSKYFQQAANELFGFPIGSRRTVLQYLKLLRMWLNNFYPPVLGYHRIHSIANSHSRSRFVQKKLGTKYDSFWVTPSTSLQSWAALPNCATEPWRWFKMGKKWQQDFMFHLYSIKDASKITAPWELKKKIFFFWDLSPYWRLTCCCVRAADTFTEHFQLFSCKCVWNGQFSFVFQWQV